MLSLDARLHLEQLFDTYCPLLTSRQREAFQLHYHDDLSLAEVAEKLDISRPAVADHLRRAEECLVTWEGQLGLQSRQANLEEALRRAIRLLESPPGSDALGDELEGFRRLVT
jgi:uncharacterized protein